jgi:hypothetical protein
VRLVFILVALFSAYLTANRMAHPFVDGDLFWQRHLGEYILAHHTIPATLGHDTFTAPGAPWVAQEWLLGTIVALAFRAHALWALSLLAGLTVFATLTISALRAKRAGASLYSALAAGLFAGICLEGPFGIRAQVLAWPLLAALLLVLDCEGWTALWAIPITIAWANLHASVMLAIPVVWLDAGLYVWKRFAGARHDRALSARRKKREASDGVAVWALLRDESVRVRLSLCAAVPLAVLCTPLTIRLPLYAVSLLRSPIRDFISEWQPLHSLNTQIAFGMIPLVAIVLYGTRRLWRRRPRDYALTIFTALWTLRAVRNIELFAIVAVVPAALAVAGGEGWEDPIAALAAPIRRTVMATAIVAVFLVGVFAYHAHPITKPWNPPRQAIDELAAQPGEHDLFCADFSWCAVALGKPNIRVFLDGRADPFPVNVWKGFFEVASMRPSWPSVLNRFGINAVLVAKKHPLAVGMRLLKGWRELPPVKGCCLVFVRTD